MRALGEGLIVAFRVVVMKPDPAHVYSEVPLTSVVVYSQLSMHRIAAEFKKDLILFHESQWDLENAKLWLDCTHHVYTLHN